MNDHQRYKISKNDFLSLARFTQTLKTNGLPPLSNDEINSLKIYIQLQNQSNGGSAEKSLKAVLEKEEIFITDQEAASLIK